MNATTTPPDATAPVTAPPSTAQSALREQVRDELQRIDDERESRRDARRQQRVRDRVALFAAQQKLSPSASTTLTNLLLAEQAELRQIFQDARDNDAFDGVREKVREVRQKTDDNAGAILDDDDQKEAYAALRDEDAQRFRGPMGPPDPPPDAPPKKQRDADSR